MVMIQVEDVNHMFTEIEELKRNGWKSPVIVRAKHKVGSFDVIEFYKVWIL